MDEIGLLAKERIDKLLKEIVPSKHSELIEIIQKHIYPLFEITPDPFDREKAVLQMAPVIAKMMDEFEDHKKTLSEEDAEYYNIVLLRVQRAFFYSIFSSDLDDEIAHQTAVYTSQSMKDLTYLLGVTGESDILNPDYKFLEEKESEYKKRLDQRPLTEILSHRLDDIFVLTPDKIIELESELLSAGLLLKENSTKSLLLSTNSTRSDSMVNWQGSQQSYIYLMVKITNTRQIKGSIYQFASERALIKGKHVPPKQLNNSYNHSQNKKRQRANKDLELVKTILQKVGIRE